MSHFILKTIDCPNQGVVEAFELPEPEAVEVPHVHEYKRVSKSERTDRLTFCCTMYRCECGEFYTC